MPFFPKLMKLLKHRISNQTRSNEGTSTLNESCLKFPPEILHHIIGYYNLKTTVDRQTLMSLSLTSRAMSAYCRPLILQRITIDRSNGPNGSNSPERFGKLIHGSPDVLDIIQTLSLKINSMDGIRTTKLNHAKIWWDREQSWKAWRYVLNQDYSRLNTVELTGNWNNMCLELQHACLNIIQLETLVDLNIEIAQGPLIILTYCGPNLKRLAFGTWVRVSAHSNLSFPPPRHNSLPKLQALTIKNNVNGILEAIRDAHPGTPLLNCSRLQSLRFGQTEFAEASNSFMKSFSRSLSCIHYHFEGPVCYHCGPEPTPIDLPSLPALTFLEVKLRDRDIFAVLRWISQSVRPETPNFRLGALKILLILCNNPFDYWNHRLNRSDSEDYIGRWPYPGIEGALPNLRFVNIQGISLIEEEWCAEQITCLGPLLPEYSTENIGIGKNRDEQEHVCSCGRSILSDVAIPQPSLLSV